ncbi:MAG: tetratricopeptide repeat protein [Muribaculaceae bacterium]|nr:tetratricopeptide repeat protein [Muribaculaceae bacterium]
MNFLRPLCALAVVAALSVGAQKINPITQAVLNGYAELLQENPKDYETLYERAAQYYKLGLFPQAQDDLNAALQYTPQKNTDLRQRELSLLANVASVTGQHEIALKAINDALAINPSDYFNVFRKGNILLDLGRNDEAYRTFSNMQSLKSRSQEAYYGMAKACIRMNNFSEAETLMKEVESADPTNPVTYTRLGDLYEEMKQPENAAANYILAMSMGKNNSSAMQALVRMASTNYTAVAAALDFAADKVEDKTMMLFLKGNIALDSGNFSQAEDAFTKLLALPDAETAGVYASLAKCRFALDDTAGATEAADKAIAISGKADHHALKALIEVGAGNYEAAAATAATALRIDANLTDAYLAAAKAHIAKANGQEALSQLNQAIMLEPDNVQALMLRAYVNQELLKNQKGAMADYSRIITESPESFPDLAVKGIAQVKAGKKLDADAMIHDALSHNPSANDLFWGAVYYAQTGELDKAKNLTEQARFDGFQNRYLLMTDQTPWLNISPIRHLFK